MKNKNRIFLIGSSILMIVCLTSASSLNTLNIKAILEESQNQYTRASFNQPTWKWLVTEVVSTESTGSSLEPSLFIDYLGDIHVAWEDYTFYAGAGGDLDIFYKKFDISSSSWTNTEVVSTESTSDSCFSSLYVEPNGNKHIAWMDKTNYAGSGLDEDIFYKTWNASTSSWTTTEVVSTESSSYSNNPSLVVDSEGNVHIVWMDLTDYAGAGNDFDIFYKRWDISSSSWTTTEVISTEVISLTNESYRPVIAVDSSDNIHIAWEDRYDYAGAGTDFDIFYRSWDALTESWQTTEVVSTESDATSQFPSIAVDSVDNIHIAWEDGSNYAGSGSDLDIFYKRWNKTTSSWTTTEVVSTESSANSWYPSLGISFSNNIHITWQEWTTYGDSGTDEDIFYKKWEASSETWTTTEVISTESTDTSDKPTLTVDSEENVYIVWQDITNYKGAGTDWDIFYKRFSGPPVAPELAYIVPNPSETGVVYLDWNNVGDASTYYVYRSSSYIWSIESLYPLDTTTSSNYTDNIFTNGFYYYVIVAENNAGNSSKSNCEYVEVSISPLPAPELAFITPNPTAISSINLDWNDVGGAIIYYAYRSSSYIWSVEGMTPITSVPSSNHIDNLPAEGEYYYVIVASDGTSNSTHSNCQYVHYELPHVSEFTIILSLIGGTAAIIFTYAILRRKKNNLQF